MGLARRPHPHHTIAFGSASQTRFWHFSHQNTVSRSLAPIVRPSIKRALALSASTPSLAPKGSLSLQLSYSGPCAAGRTRTCNGRVKSPLLYRIELRRREMPTDYHQHIIVGSAAPPSIGTVADNTGGGREKPSNCCKNSVPFAQMRQLHHRHRIITIQIVLAHSQP